MKTFLSKLMDMIDGVESESELLIRLVISVAVFVLLLVFRNKISKAISLLFCKMFLRKSENAQRAVTKSIYKPLSYFIAVSGAYIATEIILPSGVIADKTLVILKLCFIALSAWFGVNLINSDFEIKMNSDISNSKRTALKFINNTLKISVITIALLLALEQFGISAAKLFTALGIGGVAVAFACKDFVENMLSGFIIIFDKPFEVGDFIELNGDKGTVVDIKIRTTRLLGVDGCEKVYPNTAMANSSIANWTKMNKRAVEETIAVTYSTNADKLDTICSDIKNILLSNDNVLKDDVRVNFSSFGNHALELSLFFYVDKTAAPDYLAVKNSINLDLKRYFECSKVDLAFESKTIYFGDELNIKK